MTHLETDSPFEDLWRIGWHAGIPAKVLKKNQANLARTDLFSDKNHYIKQKGIYEKDTFYVNFLFEHLSTLTNNIFQKDVCNLSWQPGFGKKLLFHLFLPVFQVISANRAWRKHVSKGFILNLLPSSCLLDHYLIRLNTQCLAVLLVSYPTCPQTWTLQSFEYNKKEW